jgi:hypothetical protein
MMLAEFGTGQVLWSLTWFFLFALWFGLVIVVFSDIVRSETLGGWGKGVWAVGIVILPFLGVLLYMITMHDDEMGPAKVPSAAAESDRAVLNSMLASGDLTAAEYYRATETSGAL